MFELSIVLVSIVIMSYLYLNEKIIQKGKIPFSTRIKIKKDDY